MFRFNCGSIIYRIIYFFQCLYFFTKWNFVLKIHSTKPREGYDAWKMTENEDPMHENLLAHGNIHKQRKGM